MIIEAVSTSRLTKTPSNVKKSIPGAGDPTKSNEGEGEKKNRTSGDLSLSAFDSLKVFA